MRLLVATLCVLIAAPSFAGAQPAEQNISIDKNMLARLPEDAKAKVVKALGPNLDASQLPEPDEVAAAVAHALFEPSPKRRYVVSADPGLVERTIRKQIEQLVQLNEGQPHTFERAALIKMLDEALTTARPRTQ
jgi:hypothetical protein